jgi:hypothetical protein
MPQPKMSDEQADAIMYFVKPINNPTPDVITKVAELLIAAKATKPALFRLHSGYEMPKVELPQGINFGQTMTPTEWLMFV